jgi:hypothetical protein
MKRLWGIRVEEETETAGLDIAEHGMWGYPEFYIPVPGGWNQSLQHLRHAGMAEPGDPVVDEPFVVEAEPEAA